MKTIYLSVFLFVPLINYAQNLSQNTLSTAGGYSENANGSLSWTIGETIIETTTNGSNTLTQGFHQGNLKVITLINKTKILGELKVYPIPVNDVLNVETDKTEIDYQLMDVNGKVIFTGKLNNMNHQINCSGLPNGTYLLKINNQKTHKIFKIE